MRAGTRMQTVCGCLALLCLGCNDESEPADVPEFGLITGDEATCLPRPTPNSACDQVGEACVFNGAMFGLSSTSEPMTCFCLEGEGSTTAAWLCVESDREGNTDCPLAYPHDESCTERMTCVYAASPNALAWCSCTPEADVPRWLCGL